MLAAIVDGGEELNDVLCRSISVSASVTFGHHRKIPPTHVGASLKIWCFSKTSADCEPKTPRGFDGCQLPRYPSSDLDFINTASRALRQQKNLQSTTILTSMYKTALPLHCSI